MKVNAVIEIDPEFYDAIRCEGYMQGKAEAIDELKRLIKIRLIDDLSLEGATKYGNKDAVQQANSYSPIMKYELADCIDDLLDDLEHMKEQKNEYRTRRFA